MTSRIIERRDGSAAADDAKTLLTAAAVRHGAVRMLQLAERGALADWTVDLDRLPATADFVANVVRERHPRLDPPLHARWRHFVFSGRDLWREIVSSRHSPDTAAAARAQARAAIDLAVTSVLLDAGAHPRWRFRDAATGLTAGRSEGLALASLRWFAGGALSNDPKDPLRADAAALRRLETAALEAAFQATADEPLPGAAGRTALMNRLGAAVAARPDLFALEDSPRPGGLFDALARRAPQGLLPAAAILETVLEGLGSIWPDRVILAGVPLGDCWPHPDFQGPTAAGHYVPLHKLSQWLTYSLIEPLEAAGLCVTGIDALTGLAEYRNGGLFTDMGVIVPRDAGAGSRIHGVADPFVVGWRALTVGLLDRLLPLVRGRLGLGIDAFPLACMLEGGTWAAGRIIAREKRADGGPPFQILSDGTVF